MRARPTPEEIQPYLEMIYSEMRTGSTVEALYIEPMTLKQARKQFYLAHPGRTVAPNMEELRPYLAE